MIFLNRLCHHHHHHHLLSPPLSLLLSSLDFKNRKNKQQRPELLIESQITTVKELIMSNKKARFDTWSFDEPVKSLSSWNSLSEATLDVRGHFGEESLADLNFVGYCGSTLEGEAKKIDDESKGVLSAILEETESSDDPKAGTMTPTLRLGGKKYILVALGKTGDINSKTGTAMGKAIASRFVDESSPRFQTAGVLLPASVWSSGFLKELSIAIHSSLYLDLRFRGTLTSLKPSKIPAQHLKSLGIGYYYQNDGETSPVTDEDAKAVEEGKQIATGVYLARDIVNTPHNVLNSLSLANLARKIANESNGCLTCQILEKEDCEERGMGAYLGVARASETPPQFIHLTYKPSSGEIKKTVGVVGKGLLFDTGGYNIKTAMMELMKFDCGGAAAVLGAAKAIAQIQPPGVECHFCVAACENMINDKGIVPSDVLVASNGVSIEVLNTDAEGRLTLADALVYCDKELGCEKIIELSTLTGACMVALGKVRFVRFFCVHVRFCVFVVCSDLFAEFISKRHVSDST